MKTENKMKEIEKLKAISDTAVDTAVDVTLNALDATNTYEVGDYRVRDYEVGDYDCYADEPEDE